MRFLHTVKYAFNWPIWLYGGAQNYDLSNVVEPTSIIFYASQSSYIQNDEWVWSGKFRYKCMSCAEANIDWDSSSFKPVGFDPQIPWHIEEELQDHVDNHVKLGTWGAMIYKRTYAKTHTA